MSNTFTIVISVVLHASPTLGLPVVYNNKERLVTSVICTCTAKTHDQLPITQHK